MYVGGTGGGGGGSLGGILLQMFQLSRSHLVGGNARLRDGVRRDAIRNAGGQPGVASNILVLRLLDDRAHEHVVDFARSDARLGQDASHGAAAVQNKEICAQHV